MAIRPMKWHIFGPEHEPLCWDGEALEFDTETDAKEFLASAIAEDTLLAQKQTAPAFGVTLGSSGWLQYSSPESVYSSEFALLTQVLRLDAEGAKQVIRAFFQTEPELTPARIYILADRNSWTCPPFLQFMIGPLYGYWLGKVPYQGVMIRLNDAREAWQSHEYRTVLEENYQPEYELMNTLIQASQQTTSGDPESEAAFQQTLLSALERYAITPVQRTQQLRY